jgi:hypothetical protein
MRSNRSGMLIFACALLASCVEPQFTAFHPPADKRATADDRAPADERVVITLNQGDIAHCTSVGNIKVRAEAGGVFGAEREFRNRIFALGGNAGFVTEGTLEKPEEGIAYRCLLR